MTDPAQELLDELEHKTQLIEKLNKQVAILGFGFGGMTVAWAMATYTTYKGIRLAEEVVDKHKALYERTMYLIDTLERKGIDVDEHLDEFDLIALRNMAPPMKRKKAL